jgi:hypothetical protein
MVIQFIFNDRSIYFDIGTMLTIMVKYKKKHKENKIKIKK